MPSRLPIEARFAILNSTFVCRDRLPDVHIDRGDSDSLVVAKILPGKARGCVRHGPGDQRNAAQVRKRAENRLILRMMMLPDDVRILRRQP